MKPRLHLLLVASLGWAAINGIQGTTQQAWAQPPSGSSPSESGGRDRDLSRSRFGDRSRGDWRSSRSRGDDERRGEERRGDERPPSSDTSSTTSANTSSSSRTTSSSSPPPATSTSAPSSAAAPDLDLKKWATALVAKNDKNGDMILQPEEQGSLGSSAASNDLNRDGMITIDEIVLRHSPGAAMASPPASGGSSAATSSSEPERSRYGRRDSDSSADSRSKTDDAMARRVLTGSTGKAGDKRHSYRFSRPSDKLPTGLPSWFKSRDTNGDGQVSMSEYGRTVSQSMVSEFRRYDANDDGMITPKEAAKQK